MRLAVKSHQQACLQSKVSRFTTELPLKTMFTFTNVSVLVTVILISFGNADGLVVERTIFHLNTFLLNRLITNLSLWSKSDVASRSACASECGRDSKCVSFFYNRATDVCTGHAVQFYGTEPSQEANETNYFTTHVDKRDCAEILSNDDEAEDGVYIINPLDGKGAIRVYCDMSTEGGGWTVFQRRKDGSVDFYLKWADYKAGFGSTDGEFWLGNDNIHRLSNARSSVLRIDMLDQADETGFAEYTDFYIDSETDKYTLHINVFTGDRGDSLSYHNTMKFTTKDNENDHLEWGNCVQPSRGAWWYKSCHQSNLNGLYGSSMYEKGINWVKWHDRETSLKQTEMKMRPS